MKHESTILNCTSSQGVGSGVCVHVCPEGPVLASRPQRNDERERLVICILDAVMASVGKTTKKHADLFGNANPTRPPETVAAVSELETVNFCLRACCMLLCSSSRPAQASATAVAKHMRHPNPRQYCLRWS